MIPEKISPMKKWISWLLALCMLLPFTAGACAVTVYTPGDRPEDFCITTSTREEVSLSGLLEKYDAVVLNFWFSSCQPCAREFPYLQKAYEEYTDKVYVLCISPTDDDSLIERYKAQMGLEKLHMAADLDGMIYPKYVDEGYPTTAVIDRFGVFCWKGCGSMPNTAAFMTLFEAFTGESYQASRSDYVLPDGKPESPAEDLSALAAAACADGTDADWALAADENAWPWGISADGNSIQSTNAGQDLSAAITCLTISGGQGEAFAFDYRVSSQLCEDALRVTVDGELCAYLSGETGEWKTRAIEFRTDGEHKISFSYCKDWALSEGEDTAYIRNIRILTDGSEAFCPAPLGAPEEDANGYRLIPAGDLKEITLLENGEEIRDFLPVYLSDDDTPEFCVSLGRDTLPELFFAAKDTETFLAVTEMAQEEDGYLFSLSPLSELPPSGFGYAELFPAVSGKYSGGVQAAVVLAGEEKLEAFIALYIAQDPAAEYSWKYKE